MVILVNPLAAGSLAMKKWQRVENELPRFFEQWHAHILNGKAGTKKIVERELKNGETDFVVAGGDGTVNTLLNILMTVATPDQIRHIRFGAIGLGSSNDFHKPFDWNQLSYGISYKVDLDQARLRDVGSVTYDSDGQWATTYFLVNASIGVTAEANRFFNAPDMTLRLLKRLHTPSAIFYAALRVISSFHNVAVTLQCIEKGDVTTELTNLGVVKNVHFSGNFYYGTPSSYDNGRLDVYLCHHMNRMGVLSLLRALARGKFSGIRNAESWSTTSLSVTAARAFAVEFDGEVIQTTSAHFSVLPKHIKVCP